MGSSAKRKKEKRKDFQKPKLKVGKARPKADNQTDTSFMAKAIVLNQQSLNVSAPDVAHQFQHNVSLLTSRSDSQRKDSLSYLTTFVSTHPVTMPLPMPVSGFLDKVLPLMLDGSAPVRAQSLKLMQSLKPENVRDHVAKALPFIRAGMTHLSKDIRNTAIDTLAWSLRVAGEELVSCSGGWYKTLESFITLLGWKSLGSGNQWSASKASFGSENKATARTMQVLDMFLKCGMDESDTDTLPVGSEMAIDFPLWFADANRISSKSDAFLHLNLFQSSTVDGKQMLEDREDRMQAFNAQFRSCVTQGVDAAKNEGGDLGRAAGQLAKTLKRTEITG